MAESGDNTVCSYVEVWLPPFSSVPAGRKSCGGHPPPCREKESTRCDVPSSGKMLRGLRCHVLIPEFPIPRPQGTRQPLTLSLASFWGPPFPAAYALPVGPPCTILSTPAFLTVYPHRTPHHMHAQSSPYVCMCVYVPVCPPGIPMCADSHVSLCPGGQLWVPFSCRVHV